ncbi:hypothetical protein VOLCADRAFT_98748 [Volvox carteri f. nagariensis]|uniref:Fucosyltransferase n=1 Tax=Volvox carteri f. nagariensis TaxID=3068 RepID=D8UG68_VOLCA|nr:uncharacterized protein VOLCADRAFT_98748 [Volvox carteri f. nagariensis]EFJ41326.1 hypothetical protein VOLCADRAFT_98748 [Volvox carteri f. nagariensis]|eukprot:XP_002957660.1 hypothetical protein VOLCADRAFT_98748 [Volvox carteri f. nagariensis]
MSQIKVSYLPHQTDLADGALCDLQPLQKELDLYTRHRRITQQSTHNPRQATLIGKPKFLRRAIRLSQELTRHGPNHGACSFMPFCWTLGIEASVPTAMSSGSLSGCPQWVLDYIAFHKATRLEPSAKYVLHTCYGGICGGVGDRLRGVLWSARLAAATRRVLLVSWRRPLDLTHFFQPAAIDWTLEAIPQSALGSSVQQPDAVVWQLEHNTMEDAAVGPGAPDMPLWSDAAACMFQALFQFTDLVKGAIDEELIKLYGSSQVQYSATHLRVGGLVGEGEASIGLSRFSKLNYFLRSLDCLKNISGSSDAAGWVASSAPSWPARLVVADSNYLTSMIREGVLPGLVVPSFAAAHLDTVNMADVKLHATTFISLGLLSRAHCAVYTDSGFSRVAFYLGRQSCVAIMPRHESSLSVLRDVGARGETRALVCDASDMPKPRRHKL